MHQFFAYENRNPQSRKLYPFLLNVQSDLIEETETRVVVPLYPLAHGRSPAMSSLSPVLEIEGNAYVLMTPLIAGLDINRLGQPIADLSHERPAIMAALDLLISGI